MSNPGVIKLIKSKCGNHMVWLDDNIGESIHIHIDQLRIDLTISEFYHMCDVLEDVLNDLINVENFDIHHVDSRVLFQLHGKLGCIDRVEYDEVEVGELMVNDDDGYCRVAESNRVKALLGMKNIDETKKRTSNFWQQSNSQRLMEALDFVKKEKYPVDDNYILLFENSMNILDGWHRAACLYSLYGQKIIPVKRIYFNEIKNNVKFAFPHEAICEHSDIVLYGAGMVGKIYYEQIKSGKEYHLVAWLDKNANVIEEIDGVKIDIPINIKNLKYDYVVIAVTGEKNYFDILNSLQQLGVPNEKIIWCE